MIRWIILAILFSPMTLFAQKTFMIGGNLNSFKFSGSFQYVNFSLNSGIIIREKFRLSGFIGYNRIYALGYKQVEDSAKVKFVDLGIQTQFRFIKKHIISPVLDFEMSFGINKTKNGPMLNYEGNPITNLDPTTWHGRFEKLCFSTSSYLLVDFEFDKYYFSFGPGIRYQSILKKEYYLIPEVRIKQLGFAFKLGVAYKI